MMRSDSGRRVRPDAPPSPPYSPSAGRAATVERVTRPAADVLAEWDALVAESSGTDVTQLSVWGRVRAADGFEAEYVFARLDGRLAGGAQVLVRRVPLLRRIGYISYGPLVAACGPHRDEIAAELARSLAAPGNFSMLFVQPPEEGEEVRAALVRQGFRPSTAGIAPTGSVRLDLFRTEDDLRRGLPPRMRSWIRRWPAEGVSVRIGDEHDVPVLAALMRVSAEAKGYRAPREEYLREMYTELSRNGNGVLFVGEVHGVPVTADLVTVCGSMVRGRFGGFDRSGDGRRLSVPAAARWEIIRWAKRSGHRWLDFGGLSEQVLSDAVDHGIRSCDSWPGADQAKMRYGGEPFRYPGAVELVRPTVVRRLYDLVAARGWGSSALDRVKVALRNGTSGKSHLR